MNNVSDQGKGQALASRVTVLRRSSLERWGRASTRELGRVSEPVGVKSTSMREEGGWGDPRQGLRAQED